MEKEKKADYSPPGWLVTEFHQVRLDQDRAIALDAFRKRLCPIGVDHNPAFAVNNLWMIALDLLLEYEVVLTAQLNSEKDHERTDQAERGEDPRASEDSGATSSASGEVVSGDGGQEPNPEG